MEDLASEYVIIEGPEGIEEYLVLKYVGIGV